MARQTPSSRRSVDWSLGLIVLAALLIAYHLTDLVAVVIEGEVVLATREGSRTLTGLAAGFYGGAIVVGLMALRLGLRQDLGRAARAFALSAGLMGLALLV